MDLISKLGWFNDAALSPCDLEAALIPRVRRELDKGVTLSNYWEIAVSRQDAGCYSLEGIADMAYRTVGHIGRCGKPDILVVARADDGVRRGHVRIVSHFLGERELCERRANAVARRHGVASGHVQSPGRLILEAEWCGVVEASHFLVVGKAPGAGGLFCPAHAVSRRHGEFFLCDGNWYYCDLSSKNGTRLDGKRITGTVGPLVPGAAILLAGQALIRVVDVIIS